MSHQDQVARRAIHWAKYKGARSPREAAEMTAQTKMTDDQWEVFRPAWERNWHSVPDPNSVFERLKRLLGMEPKF